MVGVSRDAVERVRTLEANWVIIWVIIRDLNDEQARILVFLENEDREILNEMERAQ